MRSFTINDNYDSKKMSISDIIDFVKPVFNELKKDLFNKIIENKVNKQKYLIDEVNIENNNDKVIINLNLIHIETFIKEEYQFSKIEKTNFVRSIYNTLEWSYYFFNKRFRVL